MLNVASEKQLNEGGKFGELASDEQIERTVQALQATPPPLPTPTGDTVSHGTTAQ